MIRDVHLNDAQAIADIYNHYIELTFITFEEQLVTAEEFVTRIEQVTEHLPWIVYTSDDKVLGYAYATRWKTRSAYRYAAEATVYLDAATVGWGIGTALYRDLLDRLRQAGMSTVIGGVALPNEASVRLHEKLGFVKVAHFKKVGWKFNRWIDVAYWQLSLSEGEPGD